MQTSQTGSLLLASLLASFAGAFHAPAPGQNREIVKMDHSAFPSMYSWSETASNWVLKSGMIPTAGLKLREEIISIRDEFQTMKSSQISRPSNAASRVTWAP